MKNISWKLIASALVILMAVIYTIPTFIHGVWPHKKINLGLDLQGGMHLILEVETNKAVESSLERVAQDMRLALRKEQVPITGLEHMQNGRITVQIEGKDQINKFDKLLNSSFKDIEVLSRSVENDVLTVSFDLPEKEADNIRKMAVRQALETIRNRIDQFGVSEPDIRQEGANNLLIQLPGIKDAERAKELIGKTALLEFKLVDENHDVNAALKGAVPPGSEILYEVRKDSQTGTTSKIPYLLIKRPVLTGSYLTDAKVQIDSQYNEPYVSIKFDKKGAQIFEKITEENAKKRLAIVLDNQVYSAPVIQERISGGEARITGQFTPQEARDLAIVLRAGALPAPVKVVEERTVGPSLGTDSIHKGLLAGLIGSGLIILFMFIYYRGSGVIADIALLFNIVMIFGGLAAFQATLTMPGIAGIILTIGMAVDANVLIFERIREELRIGKPLRAAVDAGFRMATWTILDANITTLIAGLVMFQFGTGPVKGFAVTLSLGVVSSVFTALVLTRVIFDYFIEHRKIKRLSIG